VILRRTDQSTGFSSASVSVNGVTLPHTPYDYYYGRPASSLAPGASLSMRVTVPEGDITANSTIPANVTLTAPADGSSLSVSSANTVTWTSASDPSEFRLGYYLTGDSTYHSLGMASGSARTFNAPANTLPANTRLICVYGVNSGTATLTGSVSSDSTMEVSSNYACANVTASSTPAATYYFRAAADSTRFLVGVRRAGESASFTGATVTMNGESLSFTASEGAYFARPTVAPAPGSSLEVRVTVPEGVIAAHGTLPERVTLTEPANGSSIRISDALHLSWTSASNPGGFHLIYTSGGSCCRDLGPVAGTARSFTVPAGTLPANTNSICVGAENIVTDTLTGPFSPGSTLELYSDLSCVNVTTAP
jgi:hypothetical protein